MTNDEFRTIVARAALAPSVHNVQPARWRLIGDTINVYLDESVALSVGDPFSLDAGLSCGASVAAAKIALSEHGWACDVDDLWQSERAKTDGPMRLVARIHLRKGAERDGLADQLDRRFTHRGLFSTDPQSLFGWTRSDAILLTDRNRIEAIAALNDVASLKVMKNHAFRRELTHWMRLSPRHPRFGIDGMSRDAMRMSRATALGAKMVLGPLWRLCNLVGLAPTLTAEADATVTSSVIALFYRPKGESPVTSGRAYLRMWLEATALGLAGWPMAALADDPEINAQVCERTGIEGNQRFIQAIRFGKATEPMPPRARRPIDELII